MNNTTERPGPDQPLTIHQLARLVGRHWKTIKEYCTVGRLGFLLESWKNESGYRYTSLRCWESWKAKVIAARQKEDERLAELARRIRASAGTSDREQKDRERRAQEARRRLELLRAI